METAKKVSHEESAGGVVYRKKPGKTVWLVIKTLGSKHRRRKMPAYKLPKGHLDEGESIRKAAVREVEEEGQVRAKIIDRLRSNNYIYEDKTENKKVVKKVTFFLMEFRSLSRLRHTDDELVVGRMWMPYGVAMRKLTYASEKKMLSQARQRMWQLREMERKPRYNKR